MTVYFITGREVGKVKIGYAKDPQARVVAAQSASPVKLDLERVCPGGKDVEAELHERFAEHRVRDEWFTITPEIEAFMATRPKHVWKHRGWHHAAARAEKAALASRKLDVLADFGVMP